MEWGAGMEFFSRLVDISFIFSFILIVPRDKFYCVCFPKVRQNLCPIVRDG